MPFKFKVKNTALWNSRQAKNKETIHQQGLTEQLFQKNAKQEYGTKI